MNRLDPGELQKLRSELEEENLKRQGLESAILDLEEIIRTREQNSSETSPSSEWKSRYESQHAHNNELEQQVVRLRERLNKLREKQAVSVQSTVPYPSLSETDVKKMLKRLEREKTDVQRHLNDLEWRLDNESKAFHKADEERSKLRTQLNEVTKAVEGISQGQRASRASATKTAVPQAAVRGGKKGPKRGNEVTGSPSKTATTSEMPTNTGSPTNPLSPRRKNVSEQPS